jgi:hypothetical protein
MLLQVDELLIYKTQVVLQAKEITVGSVCDLGKEIVNARNIFNGLASSKLAISLVGGGWGWITLM